MRDFTELNDLQIDAIKEVSNIGAGNAATALSVMLNRKIDMTVPRAKIASFAKIVNYVGKEDKESVGGFLRVEGSMPMGILFMLPIEQAMFFMEILFEKHGLVSSAWNEMYDSAFKEIVNILAGSYLNAIALVSQSVLNPSVPVMAIDMAGAILGEALQQIGEVSDYALVVENVFIEKKREITGHFFLLPEPGTLELLLKKLGV